MSARDIELFTEIAGDRSPLHYDDAAATASTAITIIVQGGMSPSEVVELRPELDVIVPRATQGTAVFLAPGASRPPPTQASASRPS